MTRRFRCGLSVAGPFVGRCLNSGGPGGWPGQSGKELGSAARFLHAFVEQHATEVSRLGSVSALHVHLVFVTKYRRNVFDGDAIQRLKVIFDKVCTDFEARLVDMNGEAEHVHLLINYPPKHSVSSMVNSLKGVSSRLLRIERPDIEKRYWKDVLWSPSYFAASCGGAPLGIIKQYVEQQKTPL